MKKFAVLLACVTLLVSFASCSGSTNDPPADTVRPEPPQINIHGGGEMDGNLNVDENITFGDIIRSKPTKEGYVFAGWYSDEAYTDYIDPNYITNTQYSKGTAYSKWIKADAVTYQVRDYEVTITDSGRKNQQLDIVELSRGGEYTLLDLERAGFTYIDVEITLDIKEVDDGYQYVFLYRDSQLPDDQMDLMEFYDKYVFGEATDEDPSLLHPFKYEHGAGEKDTSWDRVTFKKSLRISDLKNDLYIRYGASGKNDDTWRNKNVVVTITPVK